MSLSFALSRWVLRCVAVGPLLLGACQKNTDVVPETPMRPLTAAEQSTVSSSNDFAFRAFAKLRSGAATVENICVSPLSVSAALTMAYNGADGSTKAAMRQTLGFAPQTDAEINDSFRSVFELLTGVDSNVRFTAANSIWHGQQYQLAAPFVQQNQASFGATVQGLNFALPTAKDVINDWVKAKTQGKIASIVEQTRANDVLYLVNALHFKGSWTYSFDPQQTRPAPFILENGQTRSVAMMRLAKGKYRYYADGQQQLIDLPYGNRHFSMTLVVPQGTATLSDVAGRLTQSRLATWLAAADTTTRELFLPKFRLEYEQDLNDVLTQMGMGVAFSNQADFSRMLAGGLGGLSISSVKHKTYLDVNEEGTEAAAVTAISIIKTSLPAVVQVDRPFLFLIREKQSNAILFMGQLTNP